MTEPRQFMVKDFYGQPYGPADVATLRQWIQQGRLAPSMLVAPLNTSDFRAAGTYSEWADLFAQPGILAYYADIQPAANSLARTALICSLGGLVLFCPVCCMCAAGTPLSLLGLILGIIAFRRAYVLPLRSGRASALAAIIVSILALALTTLGIVASFWVSDIFSSLPTP